MRCNSSVFLCTYILLLIFFSGNLQSSDLFSSHHDSNIEIISSQTEIKIIKTTGNIWLAGTPSEVSIYMHIPIACKEQVPIYFDLDCNRVKSYRFIKYEDDGVLLVANLFDGSDTYLKWTAFLIVQENTYDDLPEYLPISKLSTLPDSVKQWLLPSDCCQSDNQFIIDVANSIAEGETNLIKIVQKVVDRASAIPWEFERTPSSFDAYYALNWGNSCTGHAHAAVALLRALGIPSRSILNIPYWFSGWMDQHWIADFYVPAYGWVNIEPSIGEFKFPTSAAVITYISNRSDEFPAYFTSGCDTKWSYSKPNIGQPNWGQAHHSDLLGSILVDKSVAESILSISRKTFNLYTDSWGLNHSQDKFQFVRNAHTAQSRAFDKILNNDVDGFLADMNIAVSKYEALDLNVLETIYFNDFESMNDETFSHYGSKDQWEKGKPPRALKGSYSGRICWGTKMKEMYESGADSYLESPEIDLNNYNCAYLSFWTWNSVFDLPIGQAIDGFHVEVSTDGINFQDISQIFGGKIDDPEIPQNGGWTNVILDLTDFLKNKVKIRFHFTSRTSTPSIYEGSFIDDFKITGRKDLVVNVPLDKSKVNSYYLYDNYPNPFNSTTTIKFDLPIKSFTRLAVYDILGREVDVIVNSYLPAGTHEITFDASQLSSNPYLFRITANGFTTTKKLLFIK